MVFGLDFQMKTFILVVLVISAAVVTQGRVSLVTCSGPSRQVVN